MTLAYILLIPILFANGFINILPYRGNKIKNIEIESEETFVLPPVSFCDDEKYNLNWYVVGESKKIKKNKIMDLLFLLLNQT